MVSFFAPGPFDPNMYSSQNHTNQFTNSEIQTLKNISNLPQLWPGGGMIIVRGPVLHWLRFMVHHIFSSILENKKERFREFQR